MLPTRITHSQVTLESIQTALSSTTKNLEKKLLALQLLLAGKSHKEVCSILQIGRNTLTRWIKLVNKNGMKGLSPVGKVGRPAKLQKRETDEIRMLLKSSPKETGLSGKHWTGAMFRKLLKKRYGKTFSLSASYKIYHKICASSLKQDLEPQPEFSNALSLLIKFYRRKVVDNLARPHAL